MKRKIVYFFGALGVLLVLLFPIGTVLGLLVLVVLLAATRSIRTWSCFRCCCSA